MTHLLSPLYICLLLSFNCQATADESVDQLSETSVASANSAMPDGLTITAVSSVDSTTLRYSQAPVLSVQSLQHIDGFALYALETDSVANLADLLTYQNKNSEFSAGPVAMPVDLGSQLVRQKKDLFFNALIPIVSFHNSILETRRSRLTQLAKRTSLSVAERSFITDMAVLYRLKVQSTYADTLQELLDKVGPIPPSLVLAQAAIESGWGTSRFSRQGNNLYGQRVWSDDAGGLAPKGVKNARFRLAVFPTISASVRSYMHNLNTHPAYKNLRQARAVRRRQGEQITGHALASGLGSYSTRGEDYIKDVQQMIRVNKLERLDIAED